MSSIGKERGSGFRSSLRYLRPSVFLGLGKKGTIQDNFYAGSGFV